MPLRWRVQGLVKGGGQSWEKLAQPECITEDVQEEVMPKLSAWLERGAGIPDM